MSTLHHQLAQYLQQQVQPFCWHQRHCAHFAAGWVLAATGRNVLQGLPACRTMRAWAAYIRRVGGFEALVTRCLRCSPVPPAMAQLGDVVLLPGDVTGGTLGVCAGATAACLGEGGASVHLPMAGALAAWRLREVAA